MTSRHLGAVVFKQVLASLSMKALMAQMSNRLQNWLTCFRFDGSMQVVERGF
jgi:hypothetical protein